MSLLQMSFSGGVLILAITVIRALALNKLPKRAFFLLWMVAALRLLAPFSVPSPVSVYTLAEPVEIAELPQMTAPVYVPVDVDQTRGIQIPVGQAVWAAGSVGFAALFLVSYARCRRKFQSSTPVEDAARWLAGCRLRRTVDVRRCGEAHAPLTYGVFRPVILLPEAMEWDEQTAYVLEHELVHIRRFDAVWKLVLTAAVCVHWRNPLAWVMYTLANRDIELSCDEAVVRRLGLGKKSAYAMTLISMEETKSGLSPLASGFSRNAIEERITAIMKMKKTSVIAVILAAVLVCGVSVGFATSAEESTAAGRLRFAGYEYMTVADYRDKLHREWDDPGDAEWLDRLIETMSRTASSEFMDYFLHVFSPLLSDGWQSCSFAGSDGASLEYNYTLRILDADTLRVGDYEKAHQAVAEGMRGLAAEQMEGVPALEERLSSSKLQVDITDFVLWAEEGFSGSVAQSWDELLAPYTPFGLTYAFDDPDGDGNGLTMYYQGREVSGITDKDAWITEHVGNGFSAGAIELYAVYENGKLTGLRPATEEEQAAFHQIREKNARQRPPETDPREFPNATEEDYAQFLELMKYSLPGSSAINLSQRDYQDMPLSEFNSRLLDWGNEHPEAYDRIMCDARLGDYAVELSGAEKQFAALTCQLSGMENGMYVRSLHTGRPEEDPGFSENLPEQTVVDSGVTVAWCDLFYQCSYHIADKSAVKVRERDAVVSGFRQGVRDFWNEIGMDSLLSMTEEQAVDRLNEIAEEYSTDAVRIVPMTAEDVQLDAADERGLD